MTLPSIETILQAEDATERARVFRDMIRGALLTTMNDILQEEVSALCGLPYAPTDGAGFYRAGSAKSSVHLNGKKVAINRPRVREIQDDGSSREVTLKTLQAARDSRDWEDMVMRAVLCGVSTRGQKALHPDQFNGMSAASVSQLWIKRAAEIVNDLNTRDLSGIDMLGFWIDGTVLAEGLHAIVAMAVDTAGTKHLLGFAIGGSENVEVCRDLVNGLVARGLKPAVKRPVAVLDGSKPLRLAVLEAWPEAVIQRCLVHKLRNLRGYLARKHHGKLEGFFDRLRKAQGGEAAREVLDELKAWLRKTNAQALLSVEEAGDDLIAFHLLDVPSTLNRTFLSTNHIENVMLNLKRHLGRVKRWRPETDMADRWVASGLWIAARGFRKVWHYKELPALVTALNASSETEALRAATKWGNSP